MQWYAIRSKPNKELPLWRELSARGLECYYPQLHVHPVNPRSRTYLPYFPGYMFLHVDIEQVGFSSLQWMPFSMGLVCYGGLPAEVPGNLIRAIRHRVEAIDASGGELFEGLNAGDQVSIQAGPFSGHEAIFDLHLPGTERVRVLLKLLNRQQLRLELPASYLERRKPRKGRFKQTNQV